jgi:hypothetical protein
METEDCPGYTGCYRESVLDATTGERWIEYALLGKLVRIYGEEDTSYTMVAIAAHVTEYARLLLYSIIEQIGQERVLYCDTDSIVIAKRDLRRLRYPVDAEALGALSIAETTRKLIIYGCKDYETDRGRKIKGIPLSAQNIGPGEYRYLQFDRMVTHQRQEQLSGVRAHWQHKLLSRRYDKGTVAKDGRVQPFYFDGL